jgi:hypothetical protein
VKTKDHQGGLWLCEAWRDAVYYGGIWRWENISTQYA